MKTKEIWTKGRRNCTACITAYIYKNGRIVASAEEDKITEARMLQALEKEFSGTLFRVSKGRGDGVYFESI